MNASLTEEAEIQRCIKVQMIILTGREGGDCWSTRDFCRMKKTTTNKSWHFYALITFTILLASSVFKHYFFLVRPLRVVNDKCPFDRPSDEKLYLENRKRFSMQLNKSTEFIMAAAVV